MQVPACYRLTSERAESYLMLKMPGSSGSVEHIIPCWELAAKELLLTCCQAI